MDPTKPRLDTLSEGGQDPVQKLDESGQMVFLKVKLAYFDAYLCQTMWNYAKDSMKTLKRPTLVFMHHVQALKGRGF